MPITHTHTYVELEISEAAYREIRAKLWVAGYSHCFEVRDQGQRGFGPIDMSGIAVVPLASKVSAIPDSATRLITEALKLAGGWREAIVELEDFCSEPVRLKNMLAAADQLDDWVRRAENLTRG